MLLRCILRYRVLPGSVRPKNSARRQYVSYYIDDAVIRVNNEQYTIQALSGLYFQAGEVL